MILHHDDWILELKELHADIVFITCKKHCDQGYYRKRITEHKRGMIISVYKLNIPSLWLPEFVTITESDMDITIDHTRPGIQS